MDKKQFDGIKMALKARPLLHTGTALLHVLSLLGYVSVCLLNHSVHILNPIASLFYFLHGIHYKFMRTCTVPRSLVLSSRYILMKDFWTLSSGYRLKSSSSAPIEEWKEMDQYCIQCSNTYMNQLCLRLQSNLFS